MERASPMGSGAHPQLWAGLTVSPRWSGSPRSGQGRPPPPGRPAWAAGAAGAAALGLQGGTGLRAPRGGHQRLPLTGARHSAEATQAPTLGQTPLCAGGLGGANLSRGRHPLTPGATGAAGQCPGGHRWGAGGQTPWEETPRRAVRGSMTRVGMPWTRRGCDPGSWGLLDPPTCSKRVPCGRPHPPVRRAPSRRL